MILLPSLACEAMYGSRAVIQSAATRAPPVRVTYAHLVWAGSSRMTVSLSVVVWMRLRSVCIIVAASPSWRRFARHLMVLADSRALLRDGRRIEIKRAM